MVSGLLHSLCLGCERTVRPCESLLGGSTSVALKIVPCPSSEQEVQGASSYVSSRITSNNYDLSEIYNCVIKYKDSASC